MSFISARQIARRIFETKVTRPIVRRVSKTINSVAIGGANPADFISKSACDTHLLTGANCTITLTFTPTVIGTRTATLVITDSVGVQNVQLSGVGK